MPSPSLMTHRTAHVLLLGALCAIPAACRRTTAAANLAALSDGDGAWAFGSVQLAPLSPPAVVVVHRQKTDRTWAYTLVGASKDQDDNGGDQHALQYVDLHPSEPQLLAYIYSVDATTHAGQPDTVDLWAVLKKAGLSYYQRQRVLLGTASFSTGQTHQALTLATGLKLSQLTAEPFLKHWALHYPAAPTALAPWQSRCPKPRLAARSPQSLSGVTCRPQPAAHDLCGGNPTTGACKPPPPPQTVLASSDPQAVVPTAEPEKIATGLQAVGTAVYRLPAQTQEAKVIFSSQIQAAASEEANADACSSRFYAVARALDRQINQACTLTPAPASVRNGKLSCAVTVAFADPHTYLEKVCNIFAVFRSTPDEVQHIQVLIN